MSTDEDDPVHAAALMALPPPVSGTVPSGAQRIAFLAALLMVPATIAGWSVGGPLTALSVVFGGVTSLVNFWFLSRLVVVTTSSEDLSTGKLVFKLMGKLAALGVLIALAIFALRLDAFGLLLGLGVLFAAVPLNLFTNWMAAR